MSLCTFVGGCIFNVTTLEGCAEDPLMDFCYGDGTQGLPQGPPQNCPCGNNGGPAEGCMNSTGAGGVLEGMGSPSLANDDLGIAAAQLSLSGSTSIGDDSATLVASGVPDTPGVFFFGRCAAETPFGDGFLCVASQVTRIAPPASPRAARRRRRWASSSSASTSAITTSSTGIATRPPVGRAST